MCILVKEVRGIRVTRACDEDGTVVVSEGSLPRPSPPLKKGILVHGTSCSMKSAQAHFRRRVGTVLVQEGLYSRSNSYKYLMSTCRQSAKSAYVQLRVINAPPHTLRSVSVMSDEDCGVSSLLSNQMFWCP